MSKETVYIFWYLTVACVLAGAAVGVYGIIKRKKQYIFGGAAFAYGALFLYLLFS